MKETDIAGPVMAWLERQEWDCYPEADVHGGSGGRADIAAVSGRILWIVEAKTSLSLALLEQAIGWKRAAHYISIAVPGVRPINAFAADLCRDHGIGIIRAGRHDVIEWARPRLHRHNHQSAQRIIGSLHPDMKRYAPGGTSSSGYSTAYRRTMDRVKDFIKWNPGCTIGEIVKGVEHHYASSSTARSVIPQRLIDLEKVTMVRDGKLMRFYLDGQAIESTQKALPGMSA